MDGKWHLCSRTQARDQGVETLCSRPRGGMSKMGRGTLAYWRERPLMSLSLSGHSNAGE
jgi:hypothetical protein